MLVGKTFATDVFVTAGRAGERARNLGECSGVKRARLTVVGETDETYAVELTGSGFSGAVLLTLDREKVDAAIEAGAWYCYAPALGQGGAR